MIAAIARQIVAIARHTVTKKPERGSGGGGALRRPFEPARLPVAGRARVADARATGQP
jgi:hypothetical protein